MKRSLLLPLGAAAAATLLVASIIFVSQAPAPTEGAAAPNARSVANASADWSARAAQTPPAALPGTMEAALAVADPAARAAAVSAITVRWLNADRMSFLAYLEAAEVEDAADGTDKVARLLAGLADAFPKVNEQAASSPVYNDAVQKFVELWALSDPDAALAWVDQWLLDDARDQAAATLIGAMEEADEAQALLDTIRQPYRRIEGTAALAALRAAQDPEAAYAWATSRPTPLESNIAVQKTLATLASTQPRKAADFLALQSGRINAEAAAALAHAPRQPEPAHLRPRPGLEDAEPELTPQESIEARRRDQLIRLADAAGAIAAGLAETDLATARHWAATLPEGPLRSVAQDAALGVAARHDPAGAFSAYASQPTAAPAVVGEIFASWGAADASAASARVDEIRDPVARAAAAEGLAESWATVDAEAAAGWSAARPAGEVRDAALAGLARSVGENDPQAAWRHALRIADPERRSETLTAIFPEVVAQDPETARGLLARLNVPAETRRPLQRQLDGAIKTTR